MRSFMDHELDDAVPRPGLPPLDANQKSIAILLATYNGAAFIADQLDSIERQSHRNWRVYASDDGSSDGTQAILGSYRERWGAERLRISQGPRCGHAANFLSLVQDATIEADYYAFCDQDDVWLKDKLERAIKSISSVGEKKPALYGSRTELIDGRGRSYGLSIHFRRQACLKNALVQSLAGGNTMVFNNETRLCLKLIPTIQDVIAHDWATYLLVTACEGLVIYDATPSVKYRQHGENIIGSNNKLSGRLMRIVRLFMGHFVTYSENNIALLALVSSKVPAQNQSTIAEFQKMRRETLFNRLALFKKSGLYRQTVFENVGLWIAVLFKKI